MLHRILEGARQDLLQDVRRQLGGLRVTLVRAEASEDAQKALGRSITQLDELFLLVVVGEFNAGKSAVINALLGEQVLEEGVTPTTSRIEVLRYGPERTRTPAGGGYEEITLPVGILREMSIVDTPGTNAVVRGHEALTRDFVPRSDLVLFVTSADRPFTESERAFLETIRDWGKKVVVAVNKTDILDRPGDVETVVEFVRNKMRELLSLRPEVFAVSARRAQKAKAAGVPPDRRTTGFGALEGYLTQTLDEAERLRLKLQSPVGVALRALDGVAAAARERLSVVEADAAALREIEHQLVLHLQEQSREFRLRLADVERPLAEMEKRGASFLEEKLRVAAIPSLLDRQGIAGAFRQEVFAGLATAVEKRAEGVVDAVVTGEARLWPAVVERLKRRRAVHGERMGAEVGLAPVNRARPLEALQRDCRRALDRYDAQAEGLRLAGAAWVAAAATLLLPVTGIGLAAVAVAAARTAGGTLTGILAAAALVAAGLLPLPTLRRREKGRLEEAVAGLGQGLTTALRTGFERELQAGQARVKDAVAPFAAFVRGEGERLRALSGEIEGSRRDFSALRTRIEALR
ncbi:MAG TPA: dynamin family protein [Vicinamibacteria bacterium]|nr:dynamin family protein [Vicinamibacteria bacterium]